MTDIIALVVVTILSVESSGGKDVRDGDDGRAVGPYQMWTIAVDEANRIENTYARASQRAPRVWSYADRADPVASREMCELTMIWHYRRGITDPVDLACRWNRPDGGLNVAYRKKIKQSIEKEIGKL